MHLKISLADCSLTEEKGVKRQVDGLRWVLRTRARVILLLAVWLIVTWPAAAQSTEDAPPLKLSQKATVDLAVAGDTLTYLLVLTNTGQMPLAEVVVSETTPAGTTLFGVNGPPGWMMTTPGQGRTGRVTWQAEDPVPPGAEVTLEFTITLNPNAAGPIVNNTYSAQVQGWSEPVNGPPIVTQLVSPTPTWTPPRVPTETPTKTPIGAPTKLSPTRPVATATSLPNVVLEQPQSPTAMPSPAPPTSSEEISGNRSIGSVVWIVMGIVGVAIGLVVLIGRRARG